MILKLFKIKLVDIYLRIEIYHEDVLFSYRVGLVGNLGHFGQKMLSIIFVVRYDLNLFLHNKLFKKIKNKRSVYEIRSLEFADDLHLFIA